MAYNNDQDIKSQVLIDVKKYLSSVKSGDKIDISSLIKNKYGNNNTEILSPRLLKLINAVVNEMSRYDFDEAKSSVVQIFRAISTEVTDTDRVVYTFFKELIASLIRTISYNSIYSAKSDVLNVLRSGLNIFNNILNMNSNASILENDISRLKTSIEESIDAAKASLAESETQNKVGLQDSIIQSLRALQSLKAMLDSDSYGIAIDSSVIALSGNNDAEYGYYFFDLRNKLLYNSVFSVNQEIKRFKTEAKSRRLKNLFLLQR